MLLRFSFSDSALAVSCAQVIVADIIFVCSWETVLLTSVTLLFKLLG